MFGNITLEMSLKPFKQTDRGYIEGVCEAMLAQWRPLIKEADVISVLLWVADGSEILDYSGEMQQEIEWGRYIGGANPREKWAFDADPDRVGLHSRCYLYTQNPAVITYEVLKSIVSAIKKTGKRLFANKKIRVGATFDPGPEFAKSDFKYKRHNEICIGKSMGSSSMVCCYAALNADHVKYAGFEEGIPQGTPFGTFLGRQSQRFLTDLGFDYIWFSNGFGFGTETWGTTGAIFDGERFNTNKLNSVREQILSFWNLFRAQCPDFPIETRGTNLTAGIDFASDGVPLMDIYNGGFHMLPPPNSPWAALDGDFGLELAGYMSRIAKLPDDAYMFRFYTHDPWWLNSPWLDRYEGSPHDIYLPLSVARVDERGEIKAPTHLNLLTVDDSFGNMPECVPREVIAHIYNAVSHFPDRVSPVVWVYPFDEYHRSTEEFELKGMFSEDWFVRGAINNGFPLSTVVSTDHFIKTADKKIYDGAVIFTPIPKKDSDYERSMIKYIEAGGRVMFYGSVSHAGGELHELLGLKLSEPVWGELTITVCGEKHGLKVNHRPLVCNGGIDTVCGDQASVFAEVSDAQDHKRVVGIYKSVGKGAVAWLRGICSSSYEAGQSLLKPDSGGDFFIGEQLPLLLLSRFGYTIEFIKKQPASRNPVVMISRSHNAFIYCGYMPDTTVGLAFGTPYGAPLLLGCETTITNGLSGYYMQRAWHKECRVFIKQEKQNTVCCKELIKYRYGTKRRIGVYGLEDATVCIFPESQNEAKTSVLLNTQYPFVAGDPFEMRTHCGADGMYFALKNVTGTLSIGFME